MANNLYRKQKRQYSTDNGVTWKDVTPPVYQVGALIEENSDCSTEAGSIQYRWFSYDISDNYTCDTTSHTKYNLEVLQYSYDGRIWQNTTETRRGSQMESNSCDCGYTEYRWNLIPGRYVCGTEDFSKYGVEVHQVGCGDNWQNVEPYEERVMDIPIECYSTDCGMSSNEIILTFEKPNTSSTSEIQFGYKVKSQVDYEDCDFGYHRTFNVPDTEDNTFKLNLNNTTFPCDLSSLGFVSTKNLTIKGIDKFIDTTYFTSFYTFFPSVGTLGDDIEYMNLDNVKTDNAITLGYMFEGCSSLTTLDVSHFNTSKVIDMGWMFANCSGLTELDLSSWDTSNVSNMSNMFNGCSSLRYLDLSGWDFSKICIPYDSCRYTIPYYGNMDYMFANLKDCEINLQNIKYDIHTISQLKNFVNGSPFENCENITLNMIGLDSDIVACFEMLIGYADVRIITDAVFNDGSGILKGFDADYYQSNITVNNQTVRLSDHIITGGGDNPTLISIDINANYDPLYQLGGLNTLNGIANFPDTSNLTSLNSMFANSNIINFPKGLFNDVSNVTNVENMFNYSAVKYIDMADLNFINLTSTYHMFYGCDDLKEINLSGWTTPSLNNISGMFYGCQNLNKIDLSGWDVPSLTATTQMFSGCDNLTEIIGMELLNSSNNIEMYGMFSGCTSLTTLDINGLSGIKTTDVRYMFQNCTSLTSLDLSGWDTSSVTDTIQMFDGCSSLTTLDLSGWDTSNVTNTQQIFQNCTSLTSLDLSGWDTSNVKYSRNMFTGCTNLTTIYCYGCNQTTIDKLNNLKPTNCTLVY